MDRMGDEAATKFINALIKSVQTLCHGYLDFQTGIEIIGHINLSVDKGTSLDYILKEKVCKNAENSTLFISNSFHAEPKPEDEVLEKNFNFGNQVTTQNNDTTDNQSGKVSSAILSISSALTGSRGRNRRSSGSRDSNNLHPHQSTAKRRASDDQSSDFHPAKRSPHHVSCESLDSPHPASSPGLQDSKEALLALRSSGDLDGSMLPQTAGVRTDSSADIGVNLAGSVLEPIEDQTNSEVTGRDDESDGDLEVTFIKEEYMEGEGSACEYNSGGQQFMGGQHSRVSEGTSDLSLYPAGFHGSSSSATYVPGSHDLGASGQHYSSGSSGPSTSQPQPGPSGMRDKGDDLLPSSGWTHAAWARFFAGLPLNALSSGGLPSLSQSQLAQQIFLPQISPGTQGGPSGQAGASLTPSAYPPPQGKSPARKVLKMDGFAQTTGDETAVFLCELCDARFKTSSGLAYHERQNHKDLPQYRCPVCSKGFVSKGHFVGHMNMHNNTKTFECPVCCKTFAYMSSLKFHLKMHTNAQVFECPVCAKKFSYEKSYKMHLNTHNRANAFSCPQCPKRFAYRSSLQYHLKTGCRGSTE